MRIKSPPELSDQTVEERLITLDWEKNFNSFQDATRRGAFRPLCWVKTQALIDVSYSFHSIFLNECFKVEARSSATELSIGVVD